MPMKIDTLPSVAELRELLEYNPQTGVLAWRARPNEGDGKRWNARYAGTAAGSLDSGYVRIQIDGRKWLAHRLAWALGAGEPPPPGMQIDHINGNRTDNRLANLRLADHAENCANANTKPRRRPDSAHLPRGVVRSGRGYRAQVRHNGRTRHLGSYATPEEAARVAARARAELHGAFARHEPRSAA